MRAVAALAALLLGGCDHLTGYSREAPAGVYPSGPLSGPPTPFIGWRQKLPIHERTEK
jgi:hypothetical protein